MGKKNGNKRINITLSREIAEKLNEYCLRATNKIGKVVYGMRNAIGRMAFREWLEKHKDDLDIDFEHAGKKKKNGEPINIILGIEVAQQLNEYCLRVSNKRGKVVYGIKNAIGRMAYREWLEKHKDDLDIDFETLR